MIWLLLRIAVLVVARIIGNAMLLALAAAVACAAFFPLVEIVSVHFNCRGRGACIGDLQETNEFLGLIVIGCVLAAPGLFLLYFPASLFMWRRQYQQRRFAICAASIATFYAVFLILFFRYDMDSERLWAPLIPLEWLGLISFSCVGLLTGLIHYQMLIMCRKRKAGERIRPLMFFKRLDSKIEKL